MQESDTPDFRKLESPCEKLRAASHPVRAVIIELLARNRNLSVTEIQEQLNIGQPAASHHLNILKNNGILSSRREGKNIIYSLKTHAISRVLAILFPSLNLNIGI